jgi:hypothetical protein
MRWTVIESSSLGVQPFRPAVLKSASGAARRWTFSVQWGTRRTLDATLPTNETGWKYWETSS